MTEDQKKMVKELLLYDGDKRMSDRETEFLEGIYMQSYPLTEKQLKWLNDIWQEIFG